MYISQEYVQEEQQNPAVGLVLVPTDRLFPTDITAVMSCLTFDLSVWMYSKWPPSCWKVMGLWLKNHWNVTSSEVSCVALQLSTTLSPTVTSTLWGLSSTRMASVSTKLLHCHPRQTQTFCGDAQFDCESLGRARTKPKLKPKGPLTLSH